MNVSPTEAEESLAAIQSVMHKTRHTLASGNAHISLITTGIIWMAGFLCTQFLSGQLLTYIWLGLSILGSALATFLSIRTRNRVHSPTAAAMAKRIALIWLLLAVYCGAAIAITWPVDGKQLTMLIILFVMVAWMVMGQLLSFTSAWLGLLLIALLLAGYFLLPGLFYLWIAILGGGGMIAMGLNIRYRW